jgi:hypothetical protein
MSPSTWSTALPLIYGASSLISTGCNVALLVVVLTVVRRHRPDAYRPLLLWAALSLGLGIVGWLGALFVTVVAARRSVESMFLGQAINAGVGIAMHVALVLLLIRGLVALAQPPKQPRVEGLPPYR